MGRRKIYRTEEEMREAILSILVANKGHVLSLERIRRELEVKERELPLFKRTLKKLIKEGKVRSYVGLSSSLQLKQSL